MPKKPVSTRIDYLAKQDYGKVPAYLGRVKSQIQEEYKMIEEMQMSNQPQQVLNPQTPPSDPYPAALNLRPFNTSRSLSS